jgi:alkylation response protein AidB-like acyl-CoA dehydrogenase
VLARSAEIAEEVLFPAALQVDAADRVPSTHLDLLAEEGFYGLMAPSGHGGLDYDSILRITETFAGACLSTTFVWLQHHSTVRALADRAPAALRAEWLGELVAGRVRAGIALAGIRPGAAQLRARPVSGGYVLDGEVPWVTGWNMIDVLRVAARDPDGGIVFGLLDARSTEALSVRPLRLVAANASNTVNITFDGYFVPAERIIGGMTEQEWQERDAAGLRFNGSLPLGLAARCCSMLGPSKLDEELASARAALDDAQTPELPSARATASELAMRAASALVASTGSRAVLLDSQAQRLAREAMFLMVFASRPAIKESLVARLTDRP